MKRREFGASSLGAFGLAALGLPAQAQVQAQSSAFDPLADDFLEKLWQLDPDAAVAAGRFEFAERLVLPGAAYRARKRAFLQTWLARFERVADASLSTSQRMDRAMLLGKLKSDLWRLDVLREWAWNPSDYNPAGLIDLVLNTDWAPLQQRVKALHRRVQQLPRFYADARASVAGVTREHTELALQQAPGVLSVLDDVESRAQQVGMGQLTAPALRAARQAAAGWQAHLNKLLPSARRPWRLGAALYEPKFVHDIQSARTARETYELALARREEVLASMQTQAAALWPTVIGAEAPPADRFALIGRVIAKLSERHVTRERFVDEIRAQIPQLEAWVREKDLLSQDASKPLEVREAPLYQRGVAGASIEAPGPYRPQDRTFYNVTPLDDLTPEQAESTLREYNHWILQILNIHEAIPGHYTQLLHANRAPSKVKALFGSGSMVEGWAVYGERVMIESGYGASPEMTLMYGKWHLRSVTNTVLDYSVHVLGMGEKEALDLLVRQAFQTEREAKEKWRRVQLTSVQLTSYFSGYSEIFALREQLKSRPGFNLKGFHEQFLSYGSAPVRLIAAEFL
ncbi:MULTISPECIES: DUF885 domain-containing protein [unclassified Roseateles]|uniref:DUF885 domain-containing protein n=1 Tax=unclassified Roseateles TaxID=2626991 RepID=UPI0006FA5707|nr:MULTISPECIES: DUF885 domain-containing protein [unclassified Roseateles]KQW51251.1 hypothetical protein ASC81_00955 [Pelomonas sp. Root405]KRA77483.1 hypothetical protein ASD88_00955 [Pelomonas sp. Root662]